MGSNRIRRRRAAMIGLLMAATSLTPAFAQTAAASDTLAAGFAEPPSSARPRVWWHWMNGNVTKEGIRKDLNG